MLGRAPRCVSVSLCVCVYVYVPSCEMKTSRGMLSFQFSGSPFIPFISYNSSALHILWSFFPVVIFFACLLVKNGSTVVKKEAPASALEANGLEGPSVGWFRGNLLVDCHHLLLWGAKVQLHRFHYNTLVLVVLKEQLPLCLVAGNFSLGRREKNLLSDLCMLLCLAYALCLSIKSWLLAFWQRFFF